MRPPTGSTGSTGTSLYIRQLLRGELEEWAAFCEHCFSAKLPSSPSAAFFMRKVHNDPEFDCTQVFVAIDGGPSAPIAAASSSASIGSGSFVGTLRIFERIICLNGKQVRTAGIGEVCTDASYRGQGIASLLLDRCLTYCHDQQISLSSLHAAPKFVPFYQSRGWTMCQPVGYAEITTAATTVMLHSADIASPSANSQHTASGYEIVDLHASQWGKQTSDAWLAIAPLYDSWNANISGTTVRNRSYWDTWVAGEWQARNACVSVVCDADSKNAVAYVVLAQNKGRLCVLECAVSCGIKVQDARDVWDALLKQTLLRMGLSDGCTIVCPLVVVRRLALDTCRSEFCVSNTEQCELLDEGWLYYVAAKHTGIASSTGAPAIDNSAATSTDSGSTGKVIKCAEQVSSSGSRMQGLSRAASNYFSDKTDNSIEELHTVWLVDGF